MLSAPGDTRLLMMVITFSIVIAIFIILGILVLRKDSKYWGNRFFMMFFCSIAIGLGFNIPVIFLENTLILSILRLITLQMIHVGLGGLLLGVLVLHIGEQEVVQKKWMIPFVAILGVVITIQCLIPTGISVVPSTTDPLYSLPFGLYELGFSQGLIIIVLLFSIKLYQNFTPELKSQFKRFIIGLLCLNITLISTVLYGLTLIPSIIDTILTIFIIIGAVLIYFGIVRGQ